MRNFFVNNRNKIITGAVIVVALAIAFVWGGNYPGSGNGSSASHLADISEVESANTTDSGKQEVPANSANSADSFNPADTDQGSTLGDSAASDSTSNDSSAVAPADTDAPSSPNTPETAIKPDAGQDKDKGKDKDKYQTQPVPAGKPAPVEPQNVDVTDKAMTCTLSVRCDTILNNLDFLDKEKWELVPEDGVIFASIQVPFYENESVFDLLRREMKKAKIHFEFSNTPIYNSAYIEGINNLYEFEAGELSGWMYKVNGWFPNYGSSRYQLQQGDVVELLYTCDLGKDIGGSDAAGGQFRNDQ